MEEPIEKSIEIPPNLKGIFQKLQEINETLQSPTNSLDTLVNGDHPVNSEGPKGTDMSGNMPSMENLVNVIDNIGRNSNKISKFTNRLVGN